MPAASGDNSRVTVALLGQKIDVLTDEVRRVMDRIEDDGRRINDLETAQAVTASQVGDLRASSRIWNGINSVGVIVGSVLAGLFGSKQ